MLKTAKLIEDGMAKALQDNCHLFKNAGECCACEKCDKSCPCEKCKQDCSYCMDESTTLAGINQTLNKVANVLDEYGLDNSVDLIIQAMQYFVSEVAIKKVAQTMDYSEVSDKLYNSLLDLSQSHPDLKHDIKNLLLEVGEEGLNPQDLSPTELAPMSDDEIELPLPSKLPEFEVDFNPSNSESELKESDKATMPPSADYPPSAEYGKTQLPPGLVEAMNKIDSLLKSAEETDENEDDSEEWEDEGGE